MALDTFPLAAEIPRARFQENEKPNFLPIEDTFCRVTSSTRVEQLFLSRCTRQHIRPHPSVNENLSLIPDAGGG